MPLVLELEQEYARAKADPKFQEEFDWLLKHYVGRPSPMYFAERMTKHYGGAKIYFKRDELKARNRFVLEPGAATWAG